MIRIHSNHQIGKLYKCSKYYLLIYPTKEKAAARPKVKAAARRESAGASASAAFWSEELKCKVRFSEPNDIFMVIEKKDNYLHVLFSEKQGWIIWNDWLGIQEA